MMRTGAAWLLVTGLLLPGIALAADRVVGVGGAATEIAFALGAGERLVGTDATSTYPHAATRLPRVGYMRSLSAEGVIALAPQLVLASADAGPPAALAQLATVGVKVARLSGDHTPEALLGNVRIVAGALRTVAAGEDLARRIEREWQATKRVLDALPGRPRVLFVLAHGSSSPMVSGDGTAADAMIRLARARNAASGFRGYKPLTAEAVLGAAPEVILVTREGLEQIGGVDGLLARPGIALTPAGQARRVLALDALYLLGFGPRLPHAVRELAVGVRAP